MSKIPEYVKNVLRKLEDAGYEAWCVGGCVRDLHLGRIPEDWDVTTSARPEETMAVFGAVALPTGLKHGTVTVKSEEGSVEVTTYRRDGDYLDHRRPESVAFTTSLEEDLLRRDFTVNAMAMDLREQVCDPYGGFQDLEAGILRCVGDGERRFEEDALRILRGLRFAACLGFEIEPEAAAAIRKKKELLREIAVERIWVEMTKLLVGVGVVRILREYVDIFGVFWPELLEMVDLNQKNRHHIYDVWEHTLHAVACTEQHLILRCAVLFHDVGKPKCMTVDENGVGHFYGHPEISAALTDELLRRLKVDNATRETVVRLVAWHDRNIPRTERGVGRALRELGETDLRRLLAVKRADNLAQAPEYHGIQLEIDKAEQIMERLLEENACVSLRQLSVTGRDLMALGVFGPAVGEGLNLLLDAVIDGLAENRRESLLSYYQQKR